MQKADETSEALPSTAGGGHESEKKLPIGSRRIWHNRIVERLPDDKWHVVGHVAGLETPGVVPPLVPDEIDQAHRKELIRKLKELIAEERARRAKRHGVIHTPIQSSK
jgi:hypothetical protein